MIRQNEKALLRDIIILQKIPNLQINLRKSYQKDISRQQETEKPENIYLLNDTQESHNINHYYAKYFKR